MLRKIPLILMFFLVSCAPPQTSKTGDTESQKPTTNSTKPIETVSLRVRNITTGQSYVVKAEVDEDEVGEVRLRRLYFEKTGWVAFVDCGLESDYSGACTDENGKDWEMEGSNNQ